MLGLVVCACGVAVLARYAKPRWVLVVSGVVSIIAGIVVITLPGLAIGTFITFGASLLIVVSVVNLLTLPRKV